MSDPAPDEFYGPASLVITPSGPTINTTVVSPVKKLWYDGFSVPDLSNYITQGTPTIAGGVLSTGNQASDTRLQLNPAIIGNVRNIVTQVKVNGNGSSIDAWLAATAGGARLQIFNTNPTTASIWDPVNVQHSITNAAGNAPFGLGQLNGSFWLRMWYFRNTVIAEIFNSDPTGNSLDTVPLATSAQAGGNSFSWYETGPATPQLRLNTTDTGGNFGFSFDDFYVWSLEFGAALQ